MRIAVALAALLVGTRAARALIRGTERVINALEDRSEKSAASPDDGPSVKTTPPE